MCPPSSPTPFGPNIRSMFSFLAACVAVAITRYHFQAPQLSVVHLMPPQLQPQGVQYVLLYRRITYPGCWASV